MNIRKVVPDPTYTVELTKDEYLRVRAALAVASADEKYSAPERNDWDRLWNELYDGA